jgi:membrane-bound lytic murein transglycosylase A
MKQSIILILSLILLTSACVYKKITIRGNGNIKLVETDFDSIDGWKNANLQKSILAFLHSCNTFAKSSQNRLIGGQIGNISAADFRDVCDIASVVKGMSNKQIRNFFENWFKPFLVTNKLGDSKGLFTGYYEADLRGSKVKTDKYKYPVYAKPKDLGQNPYFTRAEIEGGALKDKGLELAFVDDKVDLFFMHIQGSGRIKLEDGSVLRLGFAGRNNHSFVAIANYMAENGYLEREKLSSQSVKIWLKANEDKADEVMNVNSAYTFFKISNSEYVVGGQGAPLLAEYSLAIDSDLIPYGMPLFIDTIIGSKGGNKERFANLMIAQDTGSAIKGAVRGDIFFGYGKSSEEKAGSTAGKGFYYMFIPINIVDKIK